MRLDRKRRASFAGFFKQYLNIWFSKGNGSSQYSNIKGGGDIQKSLMSTLMSTSPRLD